MPTFAQHLIHSLSKQDLREARKWLASPYHNQRDDLRQLFELLVANQSPDSESTHQQLYPGQPYDAQKLRLLQSYLYKCLEDFLLQQELAQQPEHTRYFLLSAYRKRGLARHFEKAWRKQARSDQRNPMQHPETHLQHYWKERERYQQRARGERTTEHNLQDMEDSLSYAMVSLKLRQACWLLAHEAVYEVGYRIDLLPEILSLASQDRYLSQPAVAIYFHCYQMLYAPTDRGLFKTFRAKLFEVLPHFPTEEVRDLFLLGINCCIRQINRTAEEDYLREALELYQRGLEEGVLLENGVLSRFTYGNVVGIALRLQALDWAAVFLKQYQPLLPSQEREAAFSLNAARLSFARQRYHDAISHLQQADYKDFINNMVAKTLLLKCYYELGEYEPLDYLMHTMRRFLRRRRMSYHQQNYRNILWAVRKLMALRPKDREGRMALMNAIEELEPLTERDWLLEQIRI